MDIHTSEGRELKTPAFSEKKLALSLTRSVSNQSPSPGLPHTGPEPALTFRSAVTPAFCAAGRLVGLR
jgi:hypothetical protein